MPLHWFSQPIYIADASGAGRYAVMNVERAAEFLMSWREHSQSEAWRAAVQACMAAMKDIGATSDAREAFKVAAIGCGKLCTEPGMSPTSSAAAARSSSATKPEGD